ncbi:MAG: extracellular solute-binding protein [Anaerolineaceae bacterium]|nr:extracellular solute-binding protein [Anaerolineaceae bacterium]
MNRLKITSLFAVIILTVILSGCTVIDDVKTALNLAGNQTPEPVSQSDGIIGNAASDSSTLLVTPNETSSVSELSEVKNSAPTPEPTPAVYTIQLWVPPQFDIEQDTPAGKALAAAISDYTSQHQNVNITLRVKATSGDSSILNTLTSANHIAKDVLPSLALISRSDMELALQRGLLKPITTNVFSDTSTWNGFARQSAFIDSSIYGLPIFGDGWILTYKPAKTGAELTDWQDILTRGLPIGFAPSSSQSFFGTFIYLSRGGKLVNDQGQPYLDQQKLIETLNFFLTGGQNGAFPPSLAQLVDQTQVWQRFNEGTMSIIVSQLSSYRHYRTNEIASHLLPLLENVTEYPLISTWNLVMIEDDPVMQQEVTKFAEYLCDPVVNEKLSYAAGYLPVRYGIHESWLDEPEYNMIKVMSENSTLVPNNQIVNKVIPVINSAVLQVIKNQAVPEDAAKEAIASFN